MPAKGARLDETEHQFAGPFEHCRAGSNHFAQEILRVDNRLSPSPDMAEYGAPGTFWADRVYFL